MEEGSGGALKAKIIDTWRWREEMAHQSSHDKSTSTTVDVSEIVLRQFKVILHNDDYTTFEFVTMVLMSIFRKSPAEAERITMQIHVNGRGVAGIYVREIAEMKVRLVHELASENGFPLRASVEG